MSNVYKQVIYHRYDQKKKKYENYLNTKLLNI